VTAGSTETGLTKLIVAAPRRRLELALPEQLPVASLLPTLLRYAGEELADDPAAVGGWAVSRLGGRPFDSGRTANQLDIRDGEVLYLTPRAAAAEEMIFDDVVDAVAGVLAELAGGGRALELGIGTGRIALPLARRGVPVHGIARSSPVTSSISVVP